MESKMDSFPIEIHDKLGWYVYRLIDPRNGQTFYVGKGRGDRVFQHIRGALKQEDALDEMDLKTKTILDIQRANLPVLHVIHRHGLENSEVAYEVEAALMDAYYGLTNISGRHGSLERGCRHVDQIISAYRAAPLEPREPLILIFIGRALDEGRDIYQAVRGVWKMSRKEAERRALVLAYDGALVVGAYRPKHWLPKGQKAKQPYAIAMKDGAPFGIAGIWENWKEPASGEWIRTFAIITTDANELVADIHDRMPVILSRSDYMSWLSEEPDPRDLMCPFPTELMRMWPISTRVNKPENDDPSIVEAIKAAAGVAWANKRQLDPGHEVIPT
jgi:hypothetical protein